jgi:hypothetical protein
MVPSNWSSSSYSLTWEIIIQTVKDNVSKMSRCIIQLKNMTVVELGKSMLRNELLVMMSSSKKNEPMTFTCQCTPHIYFRTTPIHVLQVNVLWGAHCPK